ncbi:MAG: cyclopropane-fatty-acyl-phospholipid synthase family protein [Sphingomonadaceae bacterium]
MFLLDRLLSNAIQEGALEVIDPKGRVRRYGEAGVAALRVRIADSQTAYRIGTNPPLGAGEAWMDGRLTIENGELIDLLDLVTGNLRWDRTNKLRVALWTQAKIAAWFDEKNERRRARRNVAHHYDLDDRLYDLFLDKERQYSCAYFVPGNDGPDSDLDQAQQDKLAHISAKLALEPGMRVLDIGCGWGGMARHIHKVSGAEVLGVTLSAEQLAYARQRAEELGIADKVRYELIDYRDVTGKFDRIVSVGMFEHVGRPNYRTFFNKVADLLSPDGVALLHTIGRVSGPGATDPWTAKYIFPGGYTPALSEITPAIEHAWLWTTDIEVLRLHYMKTLEHWLRRCAARRADIEAIYDARFYRMWEFYLVGAIMAFRHDDHAVFQIQISPRRDSLPLTRDYIHDTEQQVRQLKSAENPATNAEAIFPERAIS